MVNFGLQLNPKSKIQTTKLKKYQLFCPLLVFGFGGFLGFGIVWIWNFISIILNIEDRLKGKCKNVFWADVEMSKC